MSHLRPRLVQTGAVTSPALVGVFRPRLLIPRRDCESLSPEDWEHIFLHELAHFRRGDHWQQAVQLVALCVHWFNPLVWLGFRSLRADRELAADEWALRHLAAGNSAAYGSTLLKVLAAQSRHAFAPGLVGIMEDGAQMRQRLRHIVAYGPRRFAGSGVGLVLVLALAALTLGQALEKPGPADAPWARGWSVVRLAIPAACDLKDAYVDLLTPAGRAVTLTAGVVAREGVALDRIEWEGTPVRARVTLRKGKEHAEWFADAALVSKNEALPRVLPQIEVEARIIELPKALVSELPVPLPMIDGQRFAALAGVWNPPQLGVLLRSLEQKEGVSLLGAPRVTTRSQQRAVIEIAREFHYPTAYTPPDAQNAHWTPTEFETRNCGVKLDLVPTLLDEDIIELNITSELVEFLGFVDYETGKILVAAQRKPGASPLERFGVIDPEVKPGERARPIFSNRRAMVSVTMHAGQSVMLVASEAEKTEPFQAPGADTVTLTILTARRLSLEKPEESDASKKETLPAADGARTAAAAPAVSEFPVAKPVEGKPGFVTSPHAPDAGYIDVRGFPSGTEVKCPYSGRQFRLP